MTGDPDGRDVLEEVNPHAGRVMHRRADVVKPEMMGAEATFASTDRERVAAAYFVPASRPIGRWPRNAPDEALKSERAPIPRTRD